MNCPNCGAPVEAGEIFCKNCGAQLTNAAATAPKPVKVSAPVTIPSQYKPLGAWGYVGYSLLFSIPLIGFICLLIFSFNDSNLNRRSYARSYWCALLVFIVLMIVLSIIAVATGSVDELQQALEQIPTYKA